MIKTILNYDEEVLEAFFRFHLKYKDKIRWVYYSISLFFVIAGMLVVFVFDRYVFGIVIIFAALIMFLLFPIQINRAAKKTARSRYLRDPQEIIFTEANITQIIDIQKNVFYWENVLEVSETKRFIYLYISKISAIIVDKAKLEEKMITELKSLIKSKGKKYYYFKVK